MVTDVMVDLETTGGSPDINGIVQIAAVKFNYETGEVGDFFDRALHLPYGRYWDESTRSWWSNQDPAVWQQIVDRMDDPAEVIKDFHEFLVVDAPHGGFRFWAKPTSFDFPFVASYMRQFGYDMPCHFRIARDLNTWIAALHGKGPAHVDMDHVEFEGKAHNALHDTVHQIKILFAARDGNWGVEYAEFEEVQE